MLKRFTNRVAAATNSAIARHLDWIYRVTCQRPGRVIAVSLALLLLSLVSIATCRFESDIFRLFPSQQGALRLFLDSLEWTGSANNVYFLLEGERDRLPAEAETFAGKLRALTVDGKPAFGKVTYQVFDPAEASSFAEFTGFAVSRPQLFLKPEAAGSFAARLTPAAMDRSLKRAKSELASQAGMGVRDLIAADPLYLRELILPRLKGAGEAFNLDPASPYFLSRDGRVLIMIGEPVQPVNDMAFARKLVAGIDGARRGAAAKISCAGAHLSAVTDEAVMKRNISACVVSSLLVVLLLFYFTYRRFLPTLLLPLILLFGVLLALGFAGAFLSSINIISIAFTALIIGLGTDYSIHLYDRYYTERAAGRSADEALRLAVVETGHGIFTAATTTALPFFALMLSDVRALYELGFLVGLGVLFSMYATFFFLPPLLVYVSRRFPEERFAPLPGFGLGRVWDLCQRRSRLLVSLSLLLVAGLLVATPFISFEGELKNLQPHQSEAFLTQEKIERHLSITPKQMLVAVEGRDLAEVLARGSRVETLAERYRTSGVLASFAALGQLFNDPVSQQQVVAALTARLGHADPGQTLGSALHRQGFALAPFQPVIEGVGALKNAAPVPATEALARLAASPLRGVVDKHLIKRGDGYHLLIYLNYQGPEFPQDRFLAELAAIDPAARATSVDLVSRQLADSVKRSFLFGFLLGGALVLFLLLAHFESLAGIVYSLAPVLAGVVAMLGVMALTGMGLNFMNAMVLVTILGMGSDYGLHIVHRLNGSADPLQRPEFIQGGRAVLLSALTTIAGFGSLAFADYPALASIGWATNYGVGATALFALVSLPAAMVMAGRRSG